MIDIQWSYNEETKTHICESAFGSYYIRSLIDENPDFKKSSTGVSCWLLLNCDMEPVGFFTRISVAKIFAKKQIQLLTQIHLEMNNVHST